MVEHAYAPDLNSAEYHALHWSHRQKAWVYDPESTAEVLSDEHNEERQQRISREEAEQFTPDITNGEPLPDEDTIRWFFHWKGRPPGSSS